MRARFVGLSLLIAVILLLAFIQRQQSSVVVVEDLDATFVRLNQRGSGDSCLSSDKHGIVNYNDGEYITAALEEGIVQIYVSSWDMRDSITDGQWVEFNAEGNDPDGLERLIVYNTTISACDDGLQIETYSYYLPFGAQAIDITAKGLGMPQSTFVDNEFCREYRTTDINITNEIPEIGPDGIFINARPDGTAIYGTFDESGFVLNIEFLDINSAIYIPGLNKTVANCNTQLAIK